MNILNAIYVVTAVISLKLAMIGGTATAMNDGGCSALMEYHQEVKLLESTHAQTMNEIADYSVAGETQPDEMDVARHNAYRAALKKVCGE